MTTPKTSAAMKHRLVSVELDEESIGRSNPDVEHERKIAIYDLLEQNAFTPVGHEDEGPFALRLSITGARLACSALSCCSSWPRLDQLRTPAVASLTKGQAG